MTRPLSQEAAIELRDPLPLDNPQFLDREKAYWRLNATREVLGFAFHCAVDAPQRGDPNTGLGKEELEGFDSVLEELFPQLLAQGTGPIAARLARICIQVEESAQQFAAVLVAAARTYDLFQADRKMGEAA